MMQQLKVYVIVLAIVIISGSWGFLVHRTVHQLAVYELPKPMQGFFYENMDYLVRNAPRPDLRRNEDSTEAPRHYIDLEAYHATPAWNMPERWEDAVAQYSLDTLIAYGYVPYYIVMMKERLTNAFRNGQKDSVLFLATDLAHYIGDAHVPLHTTLNYDGQLTGQKGLHSLWESTVPEIQFGQFKLSSKHKARYIRHPEKTIWKVIRQSHQLLDEVFEQEKAVSALLGDSLKYHVQMRNGREYKSYSGAFAKAYYERVGKSVNKQLIRSADCIADFWYTAWVDAGKPDLDKWLPSPLDKTDRQRIQQDVKTFRQNKLLDEKLLLSRQREGNE